MSKKTVSTRSSKGSSMRSVTKTTRSTQPVAVSKLTVVTPASYVREHGLIIVLTLIWAAIIISFVADAIR